jgi:1-deoxy-D-xylulose-5-phosphate reductoisomerase
MLSFQKPDTKCFPCLSFAYKALKVGGTMPAVVNAANEVAVSAFLDRAIGFTDIPLVISKAMKSHTSQPQKNLKAVMEADMWARKKAQEIIRRCCMKKAKQVIKKTPLRSGGLT